MKLSLVARTTIAASLLYLAGAAALSAAPPPLAAWGNPDAEIALLDAWLDQTAAFDVLHEAPVFHLAHAGQLSPKDNCHRHKAAGERHWHKQDSAERGGPCVKVRGQPYRLTGHAICAAARVELVEAKERWGSDYKRVAELLKDCIVALPAPAKRR